MGWKGLKKSSVKELSWPQLVRISPLSLKRWLAYDDKSPPHNLQCRETCIIYKTSSTNRRHSMNTACSSVRIRMEKKKKKQNRMFGCVYKYCCASKRFPSGKLSLLYCSVVVPLLSAKERRHLTSHQPAFSLWSQVWCRFSYRASEYEGGRFSAPTPKRTADPEISSFKAGVQSTAGDLF